MAEHTSGVRRVLNLAPAYAFVQQLLGSNQGAQRFIDERVQPTEGIRLLDLGCGPGRLLERLPEVDYVGFDPSEAYIDAARRAHGDRGTFLCGTSDDIDVDELGRFDVAVARGVLHHLDDASARRLVAFAERALRPGGRLVTLDPAYVNDQRWVSHQLVSRDRGQNVRTPSAYADVVTTAFDDVDLTEFDDLLRFPYDHASVVATKR